MYRRAARVSPPKAYFYLRRKARLRASEEDTGELALLPVGSRIVVFGDGTGSTAAAAGDCNGPIIALASMGGRLRPAIGYNQCRSGDNFAVAMARRQYTVNQQADLIVIWSMGHNSEPSLGKGLFGTNPASDTSVLDLWKGTVQAVFDECPSARFVVSTTIYSDESEPYQAAVTAAQQAFVAGLGSRATLWNAHAVYDYTTMSWDGTHPNQLGGIALGTSLAGVLDTLVEAASADTILSDTGATTEHGANLDADWTMTGTTGTKSGTVAPTGNYATGKRITNNLTNGTSVAVVCSKDASPGTYEIQDVAVSGTPAARNTISQDDTGNITLTGVGPGDYVELLGRVIVDNGAGGAPVGLFSWSVTNSSFGILGNSGNITNYSADRATKLDIVARTIPLPAFGNSSPAGNPQYLITRWSATALTGRIRLSRPILRKVELVAYATPFYMGGDGDTTSNYLVRITGTPGVGNALRGDPGKWSGGAITWSGQWYRDGVAISGATGFTYTQQAADAGTTLTFRPRPSNSFGSDLVTASAGVAVPSTTPTNARLVSTGNFRIVSSGNYRKAA